MFVSKSDGNFLLDCLLFSSIYFSHQALVCLSVIHPDVIIVRIFETNFQTTSHFYKKITKNPTFANNKAQYQLPVPLHKLFNFFTPYQYVCKFLLTVSGHAYFGILLNSCIVFKNHYFK